MIALATLAAVCSIGQVSASDYFPLEAGSKWTYEYTGHSSGIYTQEIGAAVDVEGKLLEPILIKHGTKVTQTMFYDATPSGVYILGSDPAKFFEKPQPVFLMDTKGAKWEYVGPSPYEDDKGSGMTIKGQSKLIGAKTILGEKKDCLEVKAEVKIGLTQSTATIVKQTSIYAKGIGLVEMDQTSTAGKRSIALKVKIIKFEGPKAVGL